MSFAVEASLRRFKPEKKHRPLPRRSDPELDWAEDGAPGGRRLLLDTTVYIDALQKRGSPAFRRLILRGVLGHSAVALAELTYPLGRLDPTHPGTAAVKAEIVDTIRNMTTGRLTAPSVRAWGDAGIIAGTVARLRGAGGASQPLLNDALLYCQAAEEGVTLLTRNVADFDLIQQVAPGGTLLFYRQTP